MRKLTILFTLLTLSAGMWAETQTVSYDYPVYNTPNDPKSGIASWQKGSVEATVVESSDNVVYWGTEGQESWYVVTNLYGEVKLIKGAVCRGDVHLILYSGTLNASAENDNRAGIEVSGSNSLTIYGQLDASLNALGGWNAAGIGGGNNGSDSNITINGGQVTAHGGNGAAGIGGGYNGNGSNITINGGQVTANSSGDGAGIGGGNYGDGSNITINGGTVSAIGASNAAGIGGGYKGSGSNIIINVGQVTADNGGSCAAIGGGKDGQSSNIFVASSVLLKAGSTSDDAIETPHFTGYDMADILKDKRYVKVEEGKATAYAEGEAAGYARGKAEGIEEGKAEALGEMGVPCEDCPSVEVTKGTKTVKLNNPEKVEFKKE